jgi:hypothetical protein
MSSALKNQPSTRKAFFVSEPTHRVLSAFADQQGKTVIRTLNETIFSHPKVRRFLSKNTHLVEHKGE